MSDLRDGFSLAGVSSAGQAEGAVAGRLRRAATTMRIAYAERGLAEAARFTLRSGLRKGTLLMWQLGARTQARQLREELRSAREAAPDGPPCIAVAVTGGVGDFLVIARFLRDLGQHVGGARFDVFCPRPALAAWAFGGVPGFRQAYYDILFDGLRAEYDMALRANQMVVLYRESLRWSVLRDHPALAAVAEAVMRQRPKIDPFVTQHPWLDNFLAQKAVFAGCRRQDFLHHLAGIAYGGDGMAVPQDPAALDRFGLKPGRYVTLHNGFDANFVIAGQRATKCYPHFGAVVERLQATRPDLLFVQLGTVTSEPIPPCDLDLIGRTGMPEVAALIAGSALHIDNEGGLVHLAACLGTRAGVVFGPTPSAYFGYPGNINFDPPVCGGCWWMTRDWMDRCAKGYARPSCMQDQDPEAVARRLEAALPALQPETQPAALRRAMIGE
jgi:ADP-heptose:LPS heptosyltransferase